MMPAATDARPFLTAEWRHLAMLNYVVDPHLLAPYLPAGVELDFWQGRTYVSLIGFRFLNTRVRGVRIPFHRDFDEVNLRFYVRRADRRGVVFIKEIVPKRAIAFVARTVYGENYVRLPMRHEVSDSAVEYAWRRRGRWSQIRVKTRGEPQPLVPASHEEFIAEHYWGYARRSASVTVEYRVEHPRWEFRSAETSSFEGELAGLYPQEFEFLAAREADTAFVAEGSEVTVYEGCEIAGAPTLK